MSDALWFVAGLVVGIAVGVAVGALLSSRLGSGGVVIDRDERGRIVGIYRVPRPA